MKTGLRSLSGVLALLLLAGFTSTSAAQVLNMDQDPYLYPRAHISLQAGGVTPMGDIGGSGFDNSVTLGATAGF